MGTSLPRRPLSPWFYRLDGPHSVVDRTDVTYFDRFARPYEWLMPAVDPDVLAAGLAQAERPIERALDVGGGTGRAARALPTVDAVVVDPADGMLRRARRRELPAVRGDAGCLPACEESVDAVIVVDALHHFPDQAAALTEAARVLRSGGVLVIREFDRATFLGRAFVSAEHLLGFGSEFLTPAELVSDVRLAGLDPNVTDRGFGFTVAGVKR